MSDLRPVDRVGRVLGQLQGDMSALISALEMIAQGHVYRGSVRHDLDPEGMKAIAQVALDAVGREAA